MKVVISRHPYTTSTGDVSGTQDKVSIVVEGDENDSPDYVANAYKRVEKELNKKEES